MNKSKKHFLAFRRLFIVKYRLAVFTTTSSAADNTYSNKKSILVKKANSLNVPYWTLYKQGPFNLKERPIEFGGYML